MQKKTTAMPMLMAGMRIHNIVPYPFPLDADMQKEGAGKTLNCLK